MKTFKVLFLIANILLTTVLCAGQYTPYKYDLSIVAITQDEAPYLKEWIDYHVGIGVEHFWIYTNNCKDNTSEFLKQYEHIIEVIDWPSERKEDEWRDFTFTTQPGAYNDCMTKSRGVSKWVAAIDTDEFIIPIGKKDLPYVLESKYSHVSGLFLNWQCYGSSNQYAEEIDGNKYILKTCLMKMQWDHSWNSIGKLIVQPEHVYYFWFPHACHFTSNHWSVNTNYVANPCGNSSPILIDTIRLNHYWTRDISFREEVKIPRYKRWGGVDRFEEVRRRDLEMCQEYDPIILDYLK